MSYLQEEYKICRQVFFCPTSRSIQESKGFFTWQATYKGNWSTGKPRKPLSARAGLLPQEESVRKLRKEKKKTKEGKTVALAKATFRVS